MSCGCGFSSTSTGGGGPTPPLATVLLAGNTTGSRPIEFSDGNAAVFAPVVASVQPSLIGTNFNGLSISAGYADPGTNAWGQGLYIWAGDADGSGTGGPIELRGGQSGESGTRGGPIFIYGGNGRGTGNGGNVIISPGAGGGSGGSPGEVQITGCREPSFPSDVATKNYVDTHPGSEGPAGPTGPTGPAGPTGATGPAGPIAPVAIFTEATTARTLALGDAHSVIRCTNASPTAVTVPPAASVAFALATTIIVRQAGAGRVTLAPGAGVTLNTSQTLKTARQHASIALTKVGTDEWDVTGEREEL